MIKDSSIAATFQLPIDYFKARDVHFPLIVSRKLNGLACKYFPGQGFYSKSGVLWSASVLGHLPENAITDGPPIHGELWAPCMSLQAITSAVGIGRYEPGPGAENVRLCAFDLDSAGTADDRKAALVGYASAPLHSEVVYTERHLLSMFEDYKAEGGEGLVAQEIYSHYVHGRAPKVYKLKAYQDGEFRVVGRQEGKGERIGTLGAFVCVTRAGAQFTVGGFTLDDRIRYWTMPEDEIPSVIKIRYEMLSPDGIPLKPRFEAEEAV